MKLRMLREHYKEDNNGIWIPKASYSSKDEILKKMGYVPCTYKCRICSKFHIATYKREGMSEHRS
jgi:hypothetical protein